MRYPVFVPEITTFKTKEKKKLKDTEWILAIELGKIRLFDGIRVRVEL